MLNLDFEGWQKERRREKEETGLIANLAISLTDYGLKVIQPSVRHTPLTVLIHRDQLAGHVFCWLRWRWDKVELHLYHPNNTQTMEGTDRFSVLFVNDSRGAVSFQQYNLYASMDVTSEAEVKRHWPTGFPSLLVVIHSIESWLAKQGVGYIPTIKKWAQEQAQEFCAQLEGG